MNFEKTLVVLRLEIVMLHEVMLLVLYAFLAALGVDYR